MDDFSLPPRWMRIEGEGRRPDWLDERDEAEARAEAERQRAALRVLPSVEPPGPPGKAPQLPESALIDSEAPDPPVSNHRESQRLTQEQHRDVSGLLAFRKLLHALVSGEKEEP